MKMPPLLKELGLETVAEWINDTIRGRGKIITDASEERLRRELDPEEDHRADLLDDISGMDEPRRQVLLRRIQQAEHGAIPEQYGDISKLTENDLVTLLTKIRTDDDGSRTAKLEWLVDLPEDEFWAYIDLLWHNPLQEKFDHANRITVEVANRAAETLGATVATVDETLSQLTRPMGDRARQRLADRERRMGR